MFNLVTGSHEVAEMLARHPGVDKVAFTGSPALGRRIAVACSETFKSVNLELGGQAGPVLAHRRPCRRGYRRRRPGW